MNLKLIAKVFLIWFGLLETVSSIPQLHNSSDGQEYLIESELKYNWHEALHECARRGYQLVIIDSDAKNTDIIDLLKEVIGHSEDLWLGGNDEFSSSPAFNRSFSWSATGKRFNFTFWSVENPDNYLKREHCVHIWRNKPLYEWNDDDCTKKMGFICEINHFKKKYNDDLKHKCNVAQNITLSISDELDQDKKQQLLGINTKAQYINCLRNDWKLQIEQLQELVDEQRNAFKQLTEEMLHQVNNMNVEIEESTGDISTQFGEELNDSQSFPVNIQINIIIEPEG